MAKQQVEVNEALPEATYKLTNNTKGLRIVAGVEVIPGKSVDLTDEQLKLVEENKVAMDWIEAGDLSLT